MSKVALVTGGSSGIGREAALALAKAGLRVFELSRSGSDCAGVEHITGDVTDPASVEHAVQYITENCRRLDILVCCAGFGISGAVEFTEREAAGRQMDVNFFGTVNTVKAVLPVMREQGCGRIVCTSSVAGAIAIPFQTFYSASKAAINAYVCALRSEVAPFGIEVCGVMPGDASTGFTAARQKSCEGDEVYGGRISRSVAGMEKDETHGAPASVIGGFIAGIAVKKRVKPLYVPGFKYRLFTALAKVLPTSAVCWIVGKMYAS